MLETKFACRLCVANRPSLSIFEDNLSLLNKIQTCCNIQIYANDALSDCICSKCSKILDILVDFKTQYEETDRILRNKLSSDASEMKFVCRLCLASGPSLFIFNEDSLLLNKIQTSCSLQIHPNDGLPDHVCLKCSSILDVVINFKMQCEITDRIMRSNLLVDTADSRNEDSLTDDEVDLENDNSCDSEELNQSKTKALKNEKDTKVVVDKEKKQYGQTSRLCPYCGNVFASVDALHNHVKNHTTADDGYYECSTCSKQYRKKWKLSAHLKTHRKAIRQPCHICNKMFRDKYAVRQHIKNVHDRTRTAECKICGKKLATRGSLKYHMKIHTGEKCYECDICHSSFSGKYALIIHIRTHMGEKSYACQFCDSKFSILKGLREHERIHTGETPYSCSVCTKGFIQLSNLKSHFRNNHKGKEFSYKYTRPQSTRN